MVKWLINSRSRYGGSYTAALFVLCSHTFQRLPAKKKKNDDDKRNNRENDRFILFRYIVYILYLYIHRDGEKILCVKENHRRARRRRSGFLACFYFFCCWLHSLSIDSIKPPSRTTAGSLAALSPSFLSIGSRYYVFVCVAYPSTVKRAQRLTRLRTKFFCLPTCRMPLFRRKKNSLFIQ